jgi:hypothetical protein
VENKLVARALAHSDDHTQAQFLNDFCKFLHVCCAGKEENQLCYIADYLEPEAARILSELVEFSKLSQESRKTLHEDISKLRTEKWELEKEVELLRQDRITKAIDEEIPF